MSRLPSRLVSFLACLAVTIMLLLMGSAAHAQQAAPPGTFDYYLLTLSWSPSYCATHRGPAAKEECAQRRGFIVHGLWPQNENGTWPAFCREVPPVPKPIVAHELPVMPNATMIGHEWEKHGSCTTMTADAYFTALDHAFAGFHIPERLEKPKHALSLPLTDAKRLVTEANPGLSANMLALRCGQRGELDELRICLDTAFHPRACGRDEADACPVTVRFPAPIDSSK